MASPAVRLVCMSAGYDVACNQREERPWLATSIFSSSSRCTPRRRPPARICLDNGPAPIMCFHPETMMGTPLHSFFWHLTERNITENVIAIVCAVGIIRSARDLMAVYAKHPAEGTGDFDTDRYVSDIDMRLPRFCDDHGISRREREVLRLVLLKKSTQEIASDLFISTGTVKAHLHRIYSKAGTTSRQDLMRPVCVARLVYVQNPTVRYNNGPGLCRTVGLRAKSHRAIQARTLA